MLLEKKIRFNCKSSSTALHDALQTIKIDKSCGHSKCTFETWTEPLAKNFVRQVKFISANQPVKQCPEEVKPVVVSQLLDNPQIVHHLLHRHFVERGHLEIRLVSVRLTDDLAADDEEEGQAEEPADFGHLSEHHEFEAAIALLVQVARLAEDVDVVEEPVEEVASPRDYVCELEEFISVALSNDLDALKLEQ